VRGQTDPRESGDRRCAVGNESIEGLNFGANGESSPNMHTLWAPKFLACGVAIDSRVTISDVLFGYPATGGIRSYSQILDVLCGTAAVYVHFLLLVQKKMNEKKRTHHENS